MTEVSNLDNLRNLPITTQTVYVQGYNNPGDGGEGFFLWRTETEFKTGIYSIENYGTIIKSNEVANDQGSWIRQYDGFINVLYFGALGFGNDYTEAFQRAIDFARLNCEINPLLKGSTVYVPNGSYKISSLILKTGTSIFGESMESTILYATDGDVGDYMFLIEKGPVIINISSLNLSGQDTKRGAFLFKSDGQSNPPYHGGLWNSRISNINIYGFKGHGIHLLGGSQNSNYLLPNQFTIFENIRVFNFSDETNSLRITGQNGQITFLNCEFDGYENYDVLLDQYEFKKGKNIWIENDEKYDPAVISFINCTSQYADYGMYLSWVENITIDNCWFERLGVAITIKSNYQDKNNDNPSKSINILNNRFANASGFGSLNAPFNVKEGQCVNISKSFVNVNNNYVAVTDLEGRYLNDNSRFIVAYNNTIGGVSAQGNSFQAEKLGLTFGILQKIIVQPDNSIHCFGHKLLFIDQETTLSNPNPNPNITTIHSSINAGEYLTIRADQGKIIFYNTDNIFFKTSDSSDFFTIDNGDIVTFVKLDNITGTPLNPIYQNYQLVSIMKEVVY